MQNRWNDKEAKAFAKNPKELRVYTSRLLGQEHDLVLHGGGNTSLKLNASNKAANSPPALFVKGSGWDLENIETNGFATLRLDALLELAQRKELSDSEMVQQQRGAMLDRNSPDPSVESILHAIIPFHFVDHTHADSVLAIMNTENGEDLIKEIYGDRILIMPYVMPGLKLARMVYERTRNIDWSRYEGLMLMHHGVFTFSDNGHGSYSRMIRLASEAETFLKINGAAVRLAEPDPVLPESLDQLCQIVSDFRGQPVTVILDESAESVGFSNHPDLSRIAARGPLTPDHSIFAKRIPVILESDFYSSVEAYANEYKGYFERNATSALTRLDPAPRWAIWPGKGLLSFGSDQNEARTIIDIARHTVKVIQLSEHLGGWKPLSDADIFEVEYWELEQAKLKTR